MRSIGLRLVLSFAAVILIGVGGVAVLAGRETTSEFRTYLDRGRALFVEHMAGSIGQYYRGRGGWSGVELLLQGWLRGPVERLAIADDTGTLVADTSGRDVGQSATAAGFDLGTPLLVDGERVGTLYVMLGGTPFRGPHAIAVAGTEARSSLPRGDDRDRRPDAAAPAGGAESASSPRGRLGWAIQPLNGGRATGEDAGASRGQLAPAAPLARSTAPGTSSAEASFLEGMRQALVLSALGAAAVALLLSLLLTRYLARPLRELALAARRVAAGDLGQRVPIRSRDEVGALAAAFNEMAASLERGEAARRNLVADVAHELKTPLTVVEGTVDAMLDGIYPADQERLQSIREEIALLNKLVADLRELSLADAGGLRLERETLEPAGLVRRAVSAASTRAQTRGLALVADAPEGLPLLEGDTRRLVQVLANLLDNALRYTPAGGQVTVSAAAAPADDGRPAPASGVRFAVADTGPGIPAADLAHIFDRFYRADPSRARRSGGSGLGLAIARGYVEAHGGRIWAESSSAGTTVSFWLPALPSAPGDAAPQAVGVAAAPRHA